MKTADLYRSFYATCNNGHIWAISARIVWQSYYEFMGETDVAENVLEDYSWEELNYFYRDNSNMFSEFVLVQRNSNSVPEFFEPIDFDEDKL